MTGFTYNILLATASPEDVEEKGFIDKATATRLVHTFPFETELSKHMENPDLMIPTITFHNNESGKI